MNTKHIKEYEKSIEGRDFITSDLHGCFDLLHQHLNKVNFDCSKDRLFLAGDCCDRGPDSKYILDYLREHWIHCIRGNHEQMVIDYIESLVSGDVRDARQPYQMLFQNGGEWFFDISERHQMQIYEIFKELPLAIEIDNRIGIVHAEVPYNDWYKFKTATKAELEWNVSSIAQWSRKRYDKADTTVVRGIEKVYVGHTPTNSGQKEVLGNVHYIDGGSFFRDSIIFEQIEY